MPDFIHRYTMADPSVCDDVIEWFDGEGAEYQLDGGVGIGNTMEIIKDIKESRDIAISLEIAYEKVPALVAPLNFLWECVQEYTSHYPELNASTFSMVQAFNVQKYNPGGGYKQWHCERNKIGQNRALVWMIYLNDIEGDNGGTDFLHYNHTEKAEKGKCLIWPPDFTHSHKSNVSPDQTKYIMTGWYDFIKWPENTVAG